MKPQQYGIFYAPHRDEIMIVKKNVSPPIGADFTDEILDGVVKYVMQGTTPRKLSWPERILRKLRIGFVSDKYTREIPGPVKGAWVRITVEINH